MFMPYSFDDSHYDAFEYHAAAEGVELSVGMALRFEGGKLVTCSGTQTPEYISMTGNRKTTDGERIAVMRISREAVYETELVTANAALACGEKYTLTADGGSVTATTGGNAQVVGFDGTDAGAKVRIRFVEKEETAT